MCVLFFIDKNADECFCYHKYKMIRNNFYFYLFNVNYCIILFINRINFINIIFVQNSNSNKYDSK